MERYETQRAMGKDAGGDYGLPLRTSAEWHTLRDMTTRHRPAVTMTMTPTLRARLDAEARRTSTTRSATASRLLVEALESLADRLETKQNRRADAAPRAGGSGPSRTAPRRERAGSYAAPRGTPSKR